MVWVDAFPLLESGEVMGMPERGGVIKTTTTTAAEWGDVEENERVGKEEGKER